MRCVTAVVTGNVTGLWLGPWLLGESCHGAVVGGGLIYGKGSECPGRYVRTVALCLIERKYRLKLMCSECWRIF